MRAAPKFVYINLEARRDRRDFIEGQLKALGVDYERFPAIAPTIGSLREPDGAYHAFYKRAGEALKSLADNPKLERRATGVFGCYLSHFHIHEQAAREAWGDYIIIEDDCVVTDASLTRLISAVWDEAIFPDWDIVRNCLTSDETVQSFTASQRKSRFSTPENHHRFNGGSYFCLFKGASASRLLDLMNADFVFNIDGVYSTDRLNSYHFDFGVRHSFDFGTDIPKTEGRPVGKRVASRLKRFVSGEKA